MLGFFKKHHEKFHYYDRITGMTKIMRRYFVMNSFDGALTIFGLLIGSFTANVTDPTLVISIGIGTAIAIGCSGLTGAFVAETAERASELKKLERALQRKLDNTDYKSAHDFASLITAIVNGLIPVLSALVLLFPFFFMSIPEAYYVSFGSALVIFFGLGVFLGKFSSKDLFISGMKLLLSGIGCMALILFIEGLKGG
ncbi:MAG: VIT1/CCC1 transporter family protein [Candidatus Micrarchaeota archaeon]